MLGLPMSPTRKSVNPRVAIPILLFFTCLTALFFGLPDHLKPSSLSVIGLSSAPKTPINTLSDGPDLFIMSVRWVSGLGSMMTQGLALHNLAERFGAKVVYRPTIWALHGYAISNEYNPAEEYSISGTKKYCKVDWRELERVHAAGYIGCNVANNETSRTEILELLKLQDCGIVSVENEGQLWIDMDLIECSGDWVRSMTLSSDLSMRPGVLALHVRWGDVAPGAQFFSELKSHGYRSYSPYEVNAAVKAFKATFSNIAEIELYMENPDPDFLSRFEFEYTIVNTGSDRGDLRMLASAEYRLLSGSDYSVIAPMMSGKGVFVAKEEGEERYKWHMIDGPTYLPLTKFLADASVTIEMPEAA